MSSLVGHWLQLCCSPLRTHTCTHLSHTHAAGYKGYGLAMMVEMICGVLGGGPYAHHVREWTMADKVANLVWTIYKDMVYIYQSYFCSTIFPFQSHSCLSQSHSHSTTHFHFIPYPHHPSLIPSLPKSHSHYMHQFMRYF